MKKKKFDWLRNHPRLERIAQTDAGLLTINWVSQGVRGMEAKEIIFRFSLFLFLLFVVYVLLTAFLSANLCTGIASAFIAHTINWTLNGQFWVCARYCGFYHADVDALNYKAARVIEWVRSTSLIENAVVIGSYTNRNFQLGATSDLDLRIFYSRGIKGYARTTMALLILRAWAFLKRFPLDLYAYSRVETLNKFDGSEGWTVVKTNANMLWPKSCRKILINEN